MLKGPTRKVTLDLPLGVYELLESRILYTSKHRSVKAYLEAKVIYDTLRSHKKRKESAGEDSQSLPA